jgi:hypothetical protein
VIHRRTGLADDTTGRERFHPGFYVKDGTIYFDVGEFLREHNLPDLPEVRAVLCEEVLSTFDENDVKIID